MVFLFDLIVVIDVNVILFWGDVVLLKCLKLICIFGLVFLEVGIFRDWRVLVYLNKVESRVVLRKRNLFLLFY